MSTTTTPPVAATTRAIDNASAVSIARRITVGLGLASIAAIHVLDLPGKLTETPYLGVGYIIVIVASLVIMERLFTRASRIDFIASGVLAAAVFTAFVVNRTIGMPGAMDDIGNWLEPLGLLSLVVEAFVVWQSLAAFLGGRTAGRIG